MPKSDAHAALCGQELNRLSKKLKKVGSDLHKLDLEIREIIPAMGSGFVLLAGAGTQTLRAKSSAGAARSAKARRKR